MASSSWIGAVGIALAVKIKNYWEAQDYNFENYCYIKA